MTAAKPRLVVVAHGIGDHGGMEHVHAELIRRLVDHWDVTVVSCELAPDLRSLVTWERVRVPMRPIPLKLVCFFAAAGLRLRSVARGADAVHACGAIVPNRVELISVHLCHAGLVEATGRRAPAEAPWPRRLNTSIERYLATLAERWCYRPSRVRTLHAVSEGVGRELAAHYPGTHVVVVPNAVDAEHYRPDASVRRAVRSANGVGDDVTVVLSVGGDWNRKGVPIAVEALAALLAGGAAAELWVVGSGDEAGIRALAAGLGVDGALRLVGRKADPVEYYQAADVYVLPSLYEAYPLSALEAAASALPVVATGVNGVTELVGSNEAGIIVEREPAALADAIGRLAADPGLRRRLGEEARRRASLLTWASTCDEIEALLAVAPDADRLVTT